MTPSSASFPCAIKELGHVPAVDLAQAAIGPGMEVFSSFSQVIESDGSRMSVATALALINDKLQGILWDQEAEFDLETRAAIAWYDQYDWETGDSGRAEQIAMGKNTTIPRLVRARHHVVQGWGHPADAARRDSRSRILTDP